MAESGSGAIRRVLHVYVARVPTHDATNGLRLFSRRVVQQIPVESEAGFTYSIELLVKVHRLGWPIAETPFLWRERTAGQSRFRVLKWLPGYLRWVASGSQRRCSAVAGTPCRCAHRRHLARGKPRAMNDSMSRLRRSFLVTGGTGFIGSALVRGLLRHGAHVRCFDNNSRGAAAKLGDAVSAVEMVVGDVRDPAAVRDAVRGVHTVCHLAYINGTEFFYEKPDLILEVAVKGMMNVIDACREEGIRELIVASSPRCIRTPDECRRRRTCRSSSRRREPRVSYGGGKIISELLAMNYGRKHFDRVVIFRPHNVYGPDMGGEHVIPQFAIRMHAAFAASHGTVPFPIQGTGKETRSFVYIDDFTEGLLRVVDRGAHLNVYNIGTSHEVTIAEVAHLVAKCFGRRIEIVPGPLQSGSTLRRCPDITKLSALGFSPATSLEAGIATTVSWYRNTHAV